MKNNTTIKGAGTINHYDNVFTVPIEGKITGIIPSVVLVNPRYGHNVGNAMRACSAWGISQLWWTGSRVTLDIAKGERLPREERMKGFRSVQLFNHDDPMRFFHDCVPVAIEIKEGAENLIDFEHPENAVYIFGPEDGSVTRDYIRKCHRFVQIPTAHCLNLAAATNLVLYDRFQKQYKKNGEYIAPQEYLAENRGQ